MPRHPVCETCKWYDHNSNFDHHAGLCRVNPPIMQGQISPFAKDFDNPRYAEWPITTREEWCGKHEIRNGGE